MSNPIKTFIIEEHHEAFIVWNYAIQQGLIPSIGNTLFHVDEHSDMGTPRFNTSIHNLNGNLTNIVDFVYKELNIAGFIMPAIYQQMIDKVYWVKQAHKVMNHKVEKMFVRSYNKGGMRLISGKLKDLKNIQPDEDRKEFDYHLRTIDRLPSNKKVILDIDLDYFSCSGNPNELNEISLEISEEEYTKFINDKYHRLNYLSIGRIEAVRKDAKYFYVIDNYKEIYPSKLRVKEKEISDRVNIFIETIKKKRIEPSIICICRSRHSGYTPIDQYKLIEKLLIDKLSDVFSIQISSIDNILKLTNA